MANLGHRELEKKGQTALQFTLKSFMHHVTQMIKLH